MKLAFVIFRYFPFGGLQRDMLAIAQEAQARGHEVTIFCGAWQGEKIDSIPVLEIKTGGIFNVAGVKNFVDAFLKEFPRDQYDLLVGFNKMPRLDVYYCGDSCFAKKAYEERNFFYRITPRALLYLRYERIVYSHLSNTLVLEVSAAERPVYAKYYATPAERQILLPPGVDQRLRLPALTHALARKKIREELAFAHSDYLILCVGSGFKTKGLDRSIRAFAEFHKKNPQSHLVVIGSGDPRPFQGLIASLGVGGCVRFLGGRHDMAEIYAAGDLLLHPAYKEVTGNVIVEAMLCGLPVLATSVCGYAHYVQDYDFGELLHSPDDAQIVAAQITKLLAVDVRDWLAKADVFATSSDIFSRAERAVSLIEGLDLSSSPRSLLLSSPTKGELVLRDELIAEWKSQDVFSLMENIQGVVVREMKDRQTLRFELNGHTYYRKWHRGVGWLEILKNLLQLRLPVLGAENEWVALNKLRALSIPSLLPIAYGQRGKSPARRQSFIVTRELAGVIQLDHYFERHSVPFHRRHLLILKLAEMVRKLHEAGINHRDLYLCHFMLKPESVEDGKQPEMYLIDLHRAQCRVQVPLRWLVKDLAALYFSSFNLGFNHRDSLRFLKSYFALSLREIIEQKASLLGRIQRRAVKMYRRDFGHAPARY